MQRSPQSLHPPRGRRLPALATATLIQCRSSAVDWVVWFLAPLEGANLRSCIQALESNSQLDYSSSSYPSQAVIHFTWDLTSGDCSTLHVSDLQELEHEDSRDVWDPGWRVFSRPFLSGFIPAASGHCPRVLTTIPVCQQRSLPALYWRNFALTLHGYCPAKKHRAPLVSE